VDEQLGQELHPAAGQGRSSHLKMAVRDQVNRLSTIEYFTLLADLLKRNPPAPADAPALKRFDRKGRAPMSGSGDQSRGLSDN
jgi:hypothetical protein